MYKLEVVKAYSEDGIGYNTVRVVSEDSPDFGVEYDWYDLIYKVGVPFKAGYEWVVYSTGEDGEQFISVRVEDPSYMPYLEVGEIISWQEATTEE